MSEASSEAIIVHGCRLTPEGELSDRGRMRVDHAISLWEQGDAPNIVLTGSHSFTLRHEPTRTEAAAMYDHALARGVDDRFLSAESRSLDTVGNVVFTKTDVIVPNDWRRLTVVTSETHMPRTIDIYKHVLGPRYVLRPAPSEEAKSPDSRSLRMWEQIGNLMVDEVLEGTAIGDHEAITKRLFDVVPGYDRPNGLLGKSRFAARIALRYARTRASGATQASANS